MRELRLAIKELCWNCGEILAAGSVDCPNCVAEMRPSGRELTQVQHDAEQVNHQGDLSIPATVEVGHIAA